MEQSPLVTPACDTPPPDASTAADGALSPGLRTPGCTALQVASLHGGGLPRKVCTLGLLSGLLDAGPIG